ncbi:MAG: L-2-hydroxyglutarate oxidase [Armatimonadetes bacterium]|nr:L-2-hydroxyglutarate oxidase [Armatimonadota bacterium]
MTPVGSLSGIDATHYDVAVVGGGIVGLATTLALITRHPGLRMIVLEKERELAAHQTGHNSGVIHSGIYYKPGSYKARLCVDGNGLLKAFCDEHRVRYENCGKIIVATDERELPRLDDLFARGVANGVEGLRKMGPEEIREIEPHASGLRAIHSPNTAIVDFQEVARAMAAEARRRGVEIATGARVTAIAGESGGLRLLTTRGEVRAGYLVNCAGLYSDAVARMAGETPDVRVVPFRGEYCMLKPQRRYLVRGLIYPVPDPEFPFLGVHLTRTVHGEVEAGPNAVFAYAREGYTRWRVHPGEMLETLTYPGFWRMAGRHWRTGLHEVWRSFSTRAFVAALQRLVPDLRLTDVVRHGAGVRAQALARDGTLVDDFRILRSRRAIHVLNAPSPAATAALAIGRHVAGLATEDFGLKTSGISPRI